jgi:ArsR family transcriptional regulator
MLGKAAQTAAVARHRDDAVGPLLDVLGNETRRRILRILANEPRYFIELSRELRVSQQAVLKHLAVLENRGLISSYAGKGRGAPARKYYRLSKALYLTVGITGDVVGMQLLDVTEESSRKETVRLGGLSDDVEKIERLADVGQVATLAETVLKEVRGQVSDLQRRMMALLALRQRVMRRVHEVAGGISDPLERRILFSVLGSSDITTVEDLSAELGVREREVRDAIGTLETRLYARLGSVRAES